MLQICHILFKVPKSNFGFVIVNIREKTYGYTICVFFWGISLEKFDQA